MRRPLSLLLVLLASCTPNGPSSASGTTGGYDAGPLPDGALKHPCTLPGAVVFTANGTTEVPGGPSPVDLSFLHLPPGFCAHYFGQVGNARQLRFAPGGELFVASPTTGTTGGGGGGLDAIVVLPDDNHDGIADAPITFLSGLSSTQGLMFAKGHFYFQKASAIMRVPYAPGDRKPSGAAEQVADISIYPSALHWPKTLDMADDGTIYVGNGGDQYETCDVAHPFHGGVLKLDGTPGGTPVARGMRNPIAIRCAPGHDRCFALELAKDYTASLAGREKMLPIRSGDDWGFPCCATKDTPYQDVAPTDCSKVTPEEVSFLIGDTPFGLAFEPGRWSGAWEGHAYVANHGAAGSWKGARIVSVAMDTTTGLPVPGSNISGANEGSMVDFATGWDDSTLTHGRPAALEFSPDGRLFVASDTTGLIFWIAQVGSPLRLLALAIALAALGCAKAPAGGTVSSSSAPIVSASAPPAPPVEPAVRPQLDGRAFPDKVLALTWDDGPDAHTLELARYLHGRRVSATFFVVGEWVDGLSADPGAGVGVFATGHVHLPVLGELVALGHRLGNHTLNHVLLDGVDGGAVAHQLRENQALLEPFIANGLRLFRAPGGAWSAGASAAVDADPVTRGLVGPVRWDVDGKDWEGSLYCRSSRPAVECEPGAPGRASRVKPAVMARRYLDAVEAAGHGIVLLHDRVGHVGSRYALEVAEILVPELEARGYVFAAPVLRFSPLAARSGLDLADRVDAGLDAVERGDLNGDGRPDVCSWTREGVMCALATAHGLAQATLWLRADEIGSADGASFRLLDVNGDGRADLCARGPGGVVCGLAP